MVKKRVFCFLFFLSFSFSVFGQQRAEHLNAMSSVQVLKDISLAHTENILLGDISNFHRMSDELKIKLSRLVVHQVQKGQREIVFNSRDLSLQMREDLRKLQKESGIKIMMMVPPQVVVKIEGESFSKDSVEAALLEKLRRRCETCRFVLTDLNLPQIPKELTRASWMIHSDSQIKGNFTLPVAFHAKNHKTRTFWLSGRALKKKKVPVAKRRIPAGSTISVNDFEWVERDVTYALDGVPQKISGKKTKNSILLGHIIWRGSLQQNKAMRFGDKAQVVAGESGWSISMTAIAQQDAELGDTIRLLNPKTRKYISGTVIGKKRVRIE